MTHEGIANRMLCVTKCPHPSLQLLITPLQKGNEASEGLSCPLTHPSLTPHHSANKKLGAVAEE